MTAVEEMIQTLRESGDAEQAVKMSAYMQNLFPFLGIPKPKLKELMKPFLNSTRKEPLSWDTVQRLWQEDYREAQYVALAYLEKHQKQLVSADIQELMNLITTKSWWETVDTIDAFVGILLEKDESMKETILQWAQDENLWLRRTAIDCQQTFKEKTDAELLEQVIVCNLHSKEFFINKAIGWSLRDYSKVNPRWVRDFLDRNREGLAPLSVKEASKYL